MKISLIIIKAIKYGLSSSREGYIVIVRKKENGECSDSVCMRDLISHQQEKLIKNKPFKEARSLKRKGDRER